VPPTDLLNDPQPFLAVAVQYGLELANYRSEEAFAASVRCCLDAIPWVSGIPTLVAFPEDIGLGLILTGDYDSVADAGTLREAGAKLVTRHAGEVATGVMRHRMPVNRALLSILSQRHVERMYRTVFSAAARDYGVFLCAGSAPLHYGIAGNEVRNVSYFFGPDGVLIGAQSKTCLMEIEADGGLSLSAGRIKDLQVFRLPFAAVGVAICLDAFQPEVVKWLVSHGADVLVQPSFNPGPWTADQAAEWETGLFRAVQAHPEIRAGINPMMAGRLFDVQGEGRSSIVAPIAETPDSSGYRVRAASPTEPEVVWAEVRSPY
jgi:predicted amidohydrolase